MPSRAERSGHAVRPLQTCLQVWPTGRPSLSLADRRQSLPATHGALCPQWWVLSDQWPDGALMSPLPQLEQLFSKAFQEAGAQGDPLVAVSARPDLGDYQVNGAMALAKRIGRDGKELAAAVVERLEASPLIESTSLAGPGFINVKLRSSYLISELERVLPRSNDGYVGDNAGRVVIDYSSVNLAKEMHVGHLRSTVIGDALARIYKYLGYEVIRQNHVGDWGTQFGMLVAQLLEHDGAERMFELQDLEVLYRKAKLRFEVDEAFAEKARGHVLRLQRGDAYVLQIWREFVESSMQHCERIYAKLGVQLTRKDVRGESFYNSQLPSIVTDLLAKGIASHSDGAVVVDTPGFQAREGMPSVFLIKKGDGGYLYGTTDLAALKYRTEVLRADRCVYVVDSRQELHFRQLFDVADRAGYCGESVSYDHVAFGTVQGADGKPFKTRSGETVKLIDLIEEAEERAYQLVTSKSPDIPDSARRNIASVIGVGAIKYADLSKHRLSNYAFDLSSMLSFEGNTALYIQYAYVRSNSLIRKVEGQPVTVRNEFSHAAERRLALHLTRFEEMLSASASEYVPHLLCGYLYELASLFSKFYESCHLSNAGVTDGLRLQLCRVANEVIKQGLDLLGIGVVEEM